MLSEIVLLSVKLFVKIDFFLFVFLLGQNILRNAWLKYSKWRSNYYRKLLDQAIVQQDYSILENCQVRYPGDLYILGD
ncbi:MAG: hypothetical protein KKA19_05045, partial [Candidatus Margulisbacteria bacterium]|nr:hypothetical protein [Candidatus Margulisiibacteriota bacterium]